MEKRSDGCPSTLFYDSFSRFEYRIIVNETQINLESTDVILEASNNGEQVNVTIPFETVYMLP